MKFGIHSVEKKPSDIQQLERMQKDMWLRWIRFWNYFLCIPLSSSESANRLAVRMHIFVECIQTKNLS
jgi:hypothetical protein